jgi:hypothetical protein
MVQATQNLGAAHRLCVIDVRFWLVGASLLPPLVRPAPVEGGRLLKQQASQVYLAQHQ